MLSRLWQPWVDGEDALGFQVICPSLPHECDPISRESLQIWHKFWTQGWIDQNLMIKGQRSKSLGPLKTFWAITQKFTCWLTAAGLAGRGIQPRVIIYSFIGSSFVSLRGNFVCVNVCLSDGALHYLNIWAPYGWVICSCGISYRVFLCTKSHCLYSSDSVGRLRAGAARKWPPPSTTETKLPTNNIPPCCTLTAFSLKVIKLLLQSPQLPLLWLKCRYMCVSMCGWFLLI